MLNKEQNNELNPVPHDLLRQELRFEVQGQEMAAIAWGPADGVPVLALHGWLDNAETFYQLAPLLKGVRLIALDMMGHGLTAHRPTSMPYYIWDNVSDLLTVADELELDQIHLLGHSMGAAVSSLVAGTFPDRVASLVLLEGLAPLVYDALELPEKMADALRKRTRLRHRSPRYYSTMQEAVTARINGRFPVPKEAAERLVGRAIIKTEQGYHWRTDASVTLPSVVRLTEQQVCAFLERIRCPSLLCLAEQGIYPELTETLATRVQEIQTDLFPGSHHFHLEVEPVVPLADRINRFYLSIG